MKLYHGTTCEIMKPSTIFSKRNLDFGPGFYLTTYREQAEKWAKRKAMRNRANAIVNVYDLHPDFEQYHVLRFESDNEEWLDFVCNSRKGMDVAGDYDVIFGSVADDDVFRTVDMYFNQLWDKRRTLEELRYYKMNDQICIRSQYVLDECLVFQKAYEVKK